MNALERLSVHGVFSSSSIFSPAERDKAKLFALSGYFIPHDAGRDNVTKAFEGLEDVLAANLGV